MSDQVMNSVINPSVRAGIEAMMRDAAVERDRQEAQAAEQRREQQDQRTREADAMRQTLKAFGIR